MKRNIDIPLAKRPALYVALLVLTAIGTYAYKLRTEGIFACTAEGYRVSNAYLGYCNGEAYGDYDHGAIWFNLEPDPLRYAANADVLFLGSSRMAFGFSTISTDKWFSSVKAHPYLLGFTLENQTFASALLARLTPQAKVYVINVDRFFDDADTRDGTDILRGGSDVSRRYSEKQIWQRLHRSVCTERPTFCGQLFAYYRIRETGYWITRGTRRSHEKDGLPTADGPVTNRDQWDRYAALAKQFIAALPVDRSCVLLTIVPYPWTKRAEAQAIAAAVGLDLVDPQLQGLRTFDGSHLDPSSAERWSQAFYEAAGPQIHRCLNQPNIRMVSTH